MPQDPSVALTQAPASSTMRRELAESPTEAGSAITGTQMFALNVATVTAVDYEKLEVTLRTTTGEAFMRTPIAATFPAAGARHILGALPLVGDTCVVGWGNMESGKTRQPFILAWLIPGVTAGQDWWPTQPVSKDEFTTTPSEQVTWRGIVDRVRHKLRHFQPGNVIASSAQGSDLVLDESVLLANRRGNELRLRDQDQALVVRSQQQFHAMAGARVYAGMVQRDATLLPTSMFSDGVAWDQAVQLDAEGAPLDAYSLGASDIPARSLSPHKVFLRDADGVATSGIPWDGDTDPYTFLQKGLFINAAGRATPAPRIDSDAVYGGKPIYRVSANASNGAIDTQAETFTEYRIEVCHTSDGTLPVTEQTDGFDADRMPDAVPRDTSPLNSNAPFVEFVLGSVVGNDPFSIPGRPLYGVPLRPIVFDGDVRTPALASGFGMPVESHAGALFRLRSPMDPSAQPTFWSVSKDGRAFMSVVGPGNSWSAEASFGAGLRLGAGLTPAGESIRVEGDGKVTVRGVRGDNATGRGVEVTSEQGAVRIFAGGTETVGGIAQRTAQSGVGESGLPGLTLEAASNVLVRAGRTVVFSAQTLDFRDVTSMNFAANSGFSVASGDKISNTSKVRENTSLGKTTDTFGGPKDSLPTNGALRETQFVGNPATGFVGGTADSYFMLYGDRNETFTAGNHFTTIGVGNMSYVTGVGTWTAASGTNAMNASPAGVSAVATAGAASVSAPAGAASLTGGASALVASAGPTTTRGSVVTLSATGGKAGGIVSGADLDPVTGLPLVLLGMGSFTQVLSP